MILSYLLVTSYNLSRKTFSQVQSDHYEEFFAPELDKHGYYGLYKRKTNEVVEVFCFIMVIISKIPFDVNLLIFFLTGTQWQRQHSRWLCNFFP